MRSRLTRVLICKDGARIYYQSSGFQMTQYSIAWHLAAVHYYHTPAIYCRACQMQLRAGAVIGR
eukprot:2702746-Pleurochrysis_carterae.AAC.6